MLHSSNNQDDSTGETLILQRTPLSIVIDLTEETAVSTSPQFDPQPVATCTEDAH